MRPHIQGLEKEYGLYPNFFLSDVFNKMLLFSFAPQCIFRSKTPTYNYWLANGARLYIDCGNHPEYSSPECSASRDVLVWQKAGDEILMDMIQGANKRLWHMFSMNKNNSERLFSDQALLAIKDEVSARHLKSGDEIIRLYRNSIDIYGRNTYGEHENHIVRRERVNSKESMHHFRSTLLVHLISRIIWQGSGIVHWTGDHWEYRLSQREFRTGNLIGNTTTGTGILNEKPLINDRDEPHANIREWHRVHIIGGDANMAEVPSRLKFGTTALLIRMIEDECFGGQNFTYLLDDMRMAYRVFSRDSTLRKKYKFPNGNYSAIDLQRMFLDRAEEYSDRQSEELSADTAWTLLWWRKILDFAASDNPHEQLMYYTDASTKFSLIAGDMEKYGYTWFSNPDSTIKILKKDGSRQTMTVAARLWFWELEYHRLSRTNGMFQKLPMERVVSLDEIAFAKKNPSRGTRAEVRKKYCDDVKKSGGIIDSVDWCFIKGRDVCGNAIDISLIDPFIEK